MLPRLPLAGQIDLTYRCNNHCRHCWLRLPRDSNKEKDELAFSEIRRLVDEARGLGCRRWSISGGEPMLRDDFPEIFTYLAEKSVSYTLNTNGTLITPAIARLLKRQGVKLVALYGATPEVHDQITRVPGSFAALMRGISYLKEAGAGFTIQVVPMKDSFHQYEQMVKLANSLSPSWRIGAPWLFLSASGSAARNRGILAQRLSPADVVKLDPPDVPASECLEACVKNTPGMDQNRKTDDRLFAACVANSRGFHVDPYGGISFCSFIKDPALRYDWRQGSFAEAWESCIPSLAGAVRGGREYRENCGSCAMRDECRWCAAYAYLEHRRFSAPVGYLCRLADESHQFKMNWQREHRRFFRIAGITICIDADLPFNSKTLAQKFERFPAAPGRNAGETVSLVHHFSLPAVRADALGREVYRKPPWAIYRQGDSWTYIGISPRPSDRSIDRIAFFNVDHSRGQVYSKNGRIFQMGDLHSLSLFPTDQIWLAPLLAARQGFILHAAGMKIGHQGFLFAGHSEAGKSTTVTMLQDEGEILCDDRIIVRRWPQGFKIHGTWSHGDVPHVSAAAAPLRAILFLEKSKINRLVAIDDPQEKLKRLLPLLIKPLVTADWWEKTLAVVDKIIREVPAYRMQFDKSGRIKERIRKLAAEQQGRKRSRARIRLP